MPVIDSHLSYRRTKLAHAINLLGDLRRYNPKPLRHRLSEARSEVVAASMMHDGVPEPLVQKLDALLALDWDDAGKASEIGAALVDLHREVDEEVRLRLALEEAQYEAKNGTKPAGRRSGRRKD